MMKCRVCYHYGDHVMDKSSWFATDPPSTAIAPHILLEIM